MDAKPLFPDNDGVARGELIYVHQTGTNESTSVYSWSQTGCTGRHSLYPFGRHCHHHGQHHNQSDNFLTSS